MPAIPKNIGISPLFSASARFVPQITSLGVGVSMVKTKEDLDAVDAFIISGGELQPLLLSLQSLLPHLHKREQEGMPLLLTGNACMLLSAQESSALLRKHYAVSPYSVEYPQCEKKKIIFSVMDTKPFEASFMRSPKILDIPGDTEILSEDAENIYAIKDGALIATTFYPEFSDDLRFLEYFVHTI